VFGAYPASTAAREAPDAGASFSRAARYIWQNSHALHGASAGNDDFRRCQFGYRSGTSSPTKLDRTGIAADAAFLPWRCRVSAARRFDVRTVMTSWRHRFTVWIALRIDRPSMFGRNHLMISDTLHHVEQGGDRGMTF